MKSLIKPRPYETLEGLGGSFQRQTGARRRRDEFPPPITSHSVNHPGGKKTQKDIKCHRLVVRGKDPRRYFKRSPAKRAQRSNLINKKLVMRRTGFLCDRPPATGPIPPTRSCLRSGYQSLPKRFTTGPGQAARCGFTAACPRS